MTDFQISDESNDFEVLPREGAGGAGFMSINSATSGDGDPYEKRSDIVIVRKASSFLFIGNIMLNYELQLPGLMKWSYLLDVGNCI